MDALEEAGGGTFDIKLRSSGSQLLIEFADSGPGLKEPQRVFEPFYTTKQVGKGTGLGLSTCYGIIQQHDGDISCRNRPEGGAIFTVRNPLCSVNCAGDRARSRQSARGRCVVNLSPRQKLYIALATAIFLAQLAVAAVAKPSFALTIYGDANSCAFLILAFLAARENFRGPAGILPLFWKLFAVGLAVMLGSQAYWFYFDWRRLTVPTSPVPGDSLFILAHVFFLSALALRPHSLSAGRNLRIRVLDLILLSLWWLLLYAYFSLPWQIGRQDFASYNPSYYFLALSQHIVIVVALAILAARNAGAWRGFYLQLLVVFACIGAGNFMLSEAIDSGKYYPGSFYDTPFFCAIFFSCPSRPLRQRCNRGQTAGPTAN